ncbi:GAF domain-containing protein [Sphingomonas sp.]|uniref:GAF domain-containing protein n=1 Tax=Sphingomonas sp. TaxID=28214 RepID=UPI001B295CB2|nr:GAF domain-containing protein [Sphingomonas sp.]MBO9712908.1 hypothetical protein [Sphingomonas sp.]
MLGVFKGGTLSEADSHFGAGKATPSVERVFDRIADLVMSVFDADIAAIDIQQDDGELLVIAVSAGETPEGDAVTDPVRSLDLGYASQARVPVRLDDGAAGELIVMCRGERSFTSRDLDLLRRFALLASESWALYYAPPADG